MRNLYKIINSLKPYYYDNLAENTTNGDFEIYSRPMYYGFWLVFLDFFPLVRD